MSLFITGCPSRSSMAPLIVHPCGTPCTSNPIATIRNTIEDPLSLITGLALYHLLCNLTGKPINSFNPFSKEDITLGVNLEEDVVFPTTSKKKATKSKKETNKVQAKAHNDRKAKANPIKSIGTKTEKVNNMSKKINITIKKLSNLIPKIPSLKPN